MAMRSLAMTRVDWHMGQPLLPEHFRTQEESLWAESALRFSLLARPGWGVGDLSWDQAKLAAGLLAIDRLSLVFESGRVLCIPGNASPVMLDLTKMGRREASVYVLVKGEPNTVKVPVPEKWGTNGGTIRRLELQVELSTSQSSEGECLRLVDVQQDAAKEWSFSEKYLPPLLGVRRGVLFDGFLQRMDALLVRLRELLAKELQEHHLSGETHVLAKQALRAVYGLQSALTDVNAGVCLHPQDLYEKLRTLLIDLAVLREVSPAAATDFPYKHVELADCFDNLLANLEEIAARGHRSAPYVKFRGQDGLLRCDLPANARSARSVYLMVQKPEVAARLNLGRVKLACPTRLALVHERSLPGIPCSEIERPPCAQALSSAIDFYTLGAGQEWDAAVGEGQVVLYDTEALKDCVLYLYFRTG